MNKEHLISTMKAFVAEAETSEKLSVMILKVDDVADNVRFASVNTSVGDCVEALAALVAHIVQEAHEMDTSEQMYVAKNLMKVFEKELYPFLNRVALNATDFEGAAN